MDKKKGSPAAELKAVEDAYTGTRGWLERDPHSHFKGEEPAVWRIFVISILNTWQRTKHFCSGLFGKRYPCVINLHRGIFYSD